MKELKHLNKYFKKYWLKLLVGMLITVAAKIFQLVMPSYAHKSITVVEDFINGELNLGNEVSLEELDFSSYNAYNFLKGIEEEQEKKVKK